MPNEGRYYGPDDSRYGTEGILRKEYEALISQGWEVKLEHRETPDSEWCQVAHSRPVSEVQQTLF
jgi:hypothetical protein